MHTLINNVKPIQLPKKALAYLASVIFLVICGNLKFVLPFSPVPFSLLSMAVLVLGYLLPLRASLICFAGYIVHGLVGSPIFGASLISAASGYYVGMFVAIYFLSLAKQQSKLPLSVSLALANVIIWFFGVLYFQFFVGVKNALILGVVPFIPGDIFKLMLSYCMARRLKGKKLFSN